MSEVAAEFSSQEQELLRELGHRLEEHLPALVARWERTLDDLLKVQEPSVRKGLRQESQSSAYALVQALATGRPADGWQEGRAYGEAMALQGLDHAVLAAWLAALRQNLLTVLSQSYADDPRLDQAIVVLSKFIAVYMLRVTESFSGRQQRLLLEQQEALRRAYEEAQRRVVELEVLNEIGRAISSTMDLDALAELIYQQTGRLMDTTNFFIALCDWEEERLTFVLQFEDGQRVPPKTREITAGLTGYVARTGQPLHCPYGPDEFLKSQGIARVGRASKSWLGVPMVAQDRVIGVIAVQSYTQEGAYDEGHLRVLSAIASQAAVAVENARLYQEARRHSEEMEALYRIGAAAASRLTLQDILQSIYEQASVVMDTSAFFVALYDRERDEIAFELVHDQAGPEELTRVSKSEHGGLTGWVLDHGESLLIRDWEQEATEEQRRIAIRDGEVPRSWLGVPMLVRGEAVGVISAQSYQAGAFDQHHRQVLEMIAQQAAAAIENARLYQEAQNRWREVNTLLEVSRALGTMLDPEELLPSVLEAVARTIPAAEKGSIFLTDPRSGELVIRAQYGYSPDIVDRVRLKPGEGFAGWVFQEKRSDLVVDPRRDPRFKDTPIGVDLRSLIAAPLIGRAGAIGVINLDNCSRTGAFRESDLRLLDGLAQQVAVAIENARLFAETRRRLEELAVLNEIGRAINSTMDLDALGESIYQQTGRLMDTTNFFIGLCDWEHGVLRFLVQYEEGEKIPPETQKITAGLSGYIARTGQPLHCPYGPDEFLKSQGITRIGRASKSWLGVPMVAQDRVIGVIAVQSYTQEGAYDEGHLRVLSAIASQAAVAVENARLYQEARRRLEEMEALYRMGTASASQLSLENILQSIYEQASLVMDTSAFFVALYDREEEEISFELYYDQGKKGEPQRIRKAEQPSLTGWVLDHGESLLIRDWEQEATEEQRRIAFRDGEVPRSWLGVPMLVRGEAVGVISAQSYQAGAFDQHHRRVLEMIAQQAAAAIENARLYREAQVRVAQLSALQQVGLKLAATTHMDEVLNAVAESALELLHAGDVLIFLYDAVRGDFSLGTGLRSTGERGQFAPMPRKDGLTAMVARSGQMTIIEDVASHPLYANVPDQAGQLCSIASVPLVRAGQVLGVFNVSYYARHHFTADEKRMLQALADQAAVAVANAQLFQQMQAVMRELQETMDTQSELLHLVQELSTPIVPLLPGVLLMPLVGSIDSERGRQILDRVLATVEQKRSQVVLVDITGVPVVDTAVAQILLQTVQAVRLLGGEAVLVGLRPEVAQTLVSLGVNLTGVITRSDLQGGLAYAMRRVSQRPAGGSAPSRAGAVPRTPRVIGPARGQDQARRKTP